MDNFKYQNLYHLNSEFLEKYKQFDESSQFLSPEMFKKISKSYLNDYSKKLKVLDFNSKFELKIALKEKKNLRKKILLDYKIRKKKQAEKRKFISFLSNERRKIVKDKADYFSTRKIEESESSSALDNVTSDTKIRDTNPEQ